MRYKSTTNYNIPTATGSTAGLEARAAFLQSLIAYVQADLDSTITFAEKAEEYGVAYSHTKTARENKAALRLEMLQKLRGFKRELASIYNTIP